MKIRLLIAAAPCFAVCFAITLPAAAQDADDSAETVVEITMPPNEPMDEPDYAIEPDRMVPTPIGSEYDWVTNADFPPAAWRNGDAGLVAYDLDVDAAGTVTGCRITQNDASDILAAETCRLLRERARFEPAKDADGKPIAAVFSSYVNWDRREPEFGSGSFTVKVAFTLDERGNTRNCRVIERSGDIPPGMMSNFEREPCPGSRGNAPARDAEGRPVARDVVLMVKVETSPATPAPQPSD